MGQRASGNVHRIKREVAAEAARIIATEGQRNYLAAKQKAAERLGITNALALPSNVAVEEALKSYLALYGGDAYDQTLKRLRVAAIEAMEFLQPFQPRLVGPVLEGSADRHSRVSLHLFSDTPDAVNLFLQNNHLKFREEQRRIRWHDGGFHTLPVLVIEADGVTVELCLFTLMEQRQAPPSPIHGKPQERATITQVRALLFDAEPPQKAV